MSNSVEILVYITADEKRVLGGDPLTLLIKDVGEQKKLILELARALRANVVQLSTGDYIVISKDR
ncbi:capping complex subunit for YIEGIA [Caproiciproducens sp. R1]|uniref:capping complex subunit for YIEGIA n=1 Tax=Caproiciproducens sp. R1 TaxID=3435000 RepID=UPI004033E19D